MGGEGERGCSVAPLIAIVNDVAYTVAIAIAAAAAAAFRFLRGECVARCTDALGPPGRAVTTRANQDSRWRGLAALKTTLVGIGESRVPRKKSE